MCKTIDIRWSWNLYVVSRFKLKLKDVDYKNVTNIKIWNA